MQRRIRMTAIALGFAVLAPSVFAQQPPATRPDLLFREEWKQPPYTGELNDENRRVTQAAISNPNLELKLYGAAVREVAFGSLRWFKLDPDKVVTTVAVPNPDLARVDEVGFVDLMPSGGHGNAGWSNISTVELFAKPVPRAATRSR